VIGPVACHGTAFLSAHGALTKARGDQGRVNWMLLERRGGLFSSNLARGGTLTKRTAVSRILEHLRDDGGLQGKDIANIVSVSPATVSRWSSGKASPDLRTQTVIAELRYVVDRLSDFYTADETRIWLHTSHPMLNGERAIDLINAGRTEEVLAVIEALDAGAFT
jgi:transcriptional regulator with XRE-family HTH domain